MSTFIPQNIHSVSALSVQVDNALAQVEQLAKQGAVGSKIYSTTRSQLFVENGILKFYDASTKETNTISFA